VSGLAAGSWRPPRNERAAEAKLRILTVPGLGGSGPAHWQTRWEERHGDGRVVQRDWDRPALDEWLAALTATLAGAGEPVVLAAHSLGVMLVAHAARRGLLGSVRAALLVAPADVDDPARTPPETRGFSPVPLARLPFPATVVASQSDPYVALDRARAFATAWGATFVDAGARGHLNAESGLGDWPDGRALLTALLPR
jgi:predicted alpha/beta hydrolase family esterase